MAVHTLRLPVNYIGRATTTLEAVTLTGVGLLHTRVSRDAETGVQTLLADFDMRGVVGPGLPSLTPSDTHETSRVAGPGRAHSTEMKPDSVSRAVDVGPLRPRPLETAATSETVGTARTPPGFMTTTTLTTS